jgi:hypothetical protein
MAYKNQAGYPARGDKLATFPVTSDGGLVLNKDTVLLGDEAPGSALILINYEPSISGGYRRVSGTTAVTPGVVPNFVNVSGTPTVSGALGPITGVNVFKDTLMAARKDYVYKAQPTDVSWTRINPSNAFPGAAKVRFANYSFMGAEKVAMVGGVGQPLSWDGTTLTSLATAPANAKYVCSYLSRLWFAGYSLNKLTVSAPGSDTDYTAPNGAIEINVGNTITNIVPFRNTLYIFCTNAIYKLTGTSATDFAVSPVTQKMGTLYSDSIVELGGDLYFLAADGVRPISGTQNIGDVNLASVSKNVVSYATTLPSFADAPDYVVACTVPSKTQYRLFTGAAGIPATSCFGLLGASPNQDGVFEWCQTLGITATAAATGYISGRETVLHGDYSGTVYQQELGTDFAGTPIQGRYRTPSFAFGDPYQRKVLHKIKVFCTFLGTTTFIINPLLDLNNAGVLQPGQYALSGTGGATVYDGTAITWDSPTVTYDSDPIPIIETNLEGSFFVCGFDLVTTGGVGHEIHGFSVDYMQAGRR